MKTFDEIYQELQGADNNELNNAWEEAKNERKKANTIILWVCIIIDAIMIKNFLGSMFQGINWRGGFNFTGVIFTLVPILMVDIIIYAVINAIFGKKQNEYKRIYKQIVIAKMMSNFYTGLEYFPEKQIPKYIYDEGQFNEYYNRYKSEDYFEAQLDNKCSVQMAEVETKRVETRRDFDGKTHTTTYLIFHGLFAKIAMEKSINSELRIMQNGKFFLDSKQLKMDSSEFEKYFDVHASDQIIGMQLLTADVMQELIDFQNKTNMKYDICINGNNLYLRFHCGNMFEPKNIKDGALDRESLEKYFYMLNFTYNLSNKVIQVVNDTHI